MIDVHFRSDVTARLVKYVGSDEDVIAAARVSTIGTDSAEYLATPAEESTGLINFLMRGRHGTPFEHNSMTFLVEAPIFVFREFHRHRIGWSYNEESGRYKQLDPVFYIPDHNRPLVQVGKAGKYEFVAGDPDLSHITAAVLRSNSVDAYARYEDLLSRGIAKEVARMTLPVNIFSSMYATANARSVMSFLSLRTKAEGSHFPSFPQREIEMVAEQIEEQFASVFPVTYEAFNKHGRVAP